MEPEEGEFYSLDAKDRLRASEAWAAHLSRESVPTADGIPPSLRARARSIGPGTFGALNACLMLVGPSPGASPPSNPEATRRAQELDEYPVTVGRAHPHFFWPDTAGFFTKVRRWATEALVGGGVASNEGEALSLTMIVNLLDHQAADSRTLAQTLHLGVPRLRCAIDAALPNVIIALTQDIFDTIRSTFGAGVSQIDQTNVRQYKPPRMWIRHEGRPVLLARSPNHPSRQHPIPETYDYLAGLVRATASVN